ncbi:MAG TPA: hypothetical protein VHH36_08935 [Candidatus Thermoplasmatota archaeon]|nr:hypothetical protein [Candidatus Thermoplasmatota archaeon]
MKTFVLTTLATALAATIAAPLVAASSVEVDFRNRNVSCVIGPAEYLDDRISALFANVHVDSRGCGAYVRYDQHAVVAVCRPVWSGPAFSFSLRVQEDCDVQLIV